MLCRQGPKALKPFLTICCCDHLPASNSVGKTMPGPCTGRIGLAGALMQYFRETLGERRAQEDVAGGNAEDLSFPQLRQKMFDILIGIGQVGDQWVQSGSYANSDSSQILNCLQPLTG